MKTRQMKLVLIFAALAIVIAACGGPGRVASTPVNVPGQATNTPEGGQPGATDAPSQVETLMAGELATMTAIAGGDSPQQPTATPVVAAPTATPQGAVPTAIPPTAEEEEEEEEPTNTPKPQVDCSSPYTVKKGDWVWNIGRMCNIHPNSIIAANGLVYPYLIYPGQTLILPNNAPPFPGP